MEQCRHLLASGNTGNDTWWLNPFGDESVPTVRDHFPLADEGVGWSDEQFAEAFGDLAPVLGGYSRYGLLYVPSPPHLLDAMRPFMKTEIVEKSHLDFVMGEVNADFRFFAQDADAARSELATLLGRLREGFEHLVTLPPVSGSVD